ncbi:hypothetical protein EMIT091MI3_50151 [Kosakonia quasisacchari]
MSQKTTRKRRWSLTVPGAIAAQADFSTLTTPFGVVFCPPLLVIAKNSINEYCDQEVFAEAMLYTFARRCTCP